MIDDTKDLQLAIKVSPDAFTFDPNAYFPIVHPVLPVKTVGNNHDDADGEGAVIVKRLMTASSDLAEKTGLNGQVRSVQRNGMAKHGLEVANVVLSEM